MVSWNGDKKPAPAPPGDLIAAAPRALPAVDDAGQIYRHLGNKYMNMFSYVLSNMGALQGLTPEEAFLVWAEENKTEFYKMGAKFIPKHIEIDAKVTVEAMLAQLDTEDRARVIEGSHRVVSEGS